MAYIPAVSKIYVVILILTYIYNLQFAKCQCDGIDIGEFANRTKTGDIILFKASDNYYSLAHGSYFGHIGMVYVDEKTNEKYLFEAQFAPPHRGIFLTKLTDRILRYRGHCYWRQIGEPLNSSQIAQLEQFIMFAQTNMYYEKNVIGSYFKKVFGEKCQFGTNCAEIIFLALIAIGVFPVEHYDKYICNYMVYVTGNVPKYDTYIYKIEYEAFGEPLALYT